MALLFYGKLLGIDAAGARYAYASNTPEHWDGVVHVPNDLADGVRVEGSDRVNGAAQAIAVKAWRLRGTTGVWPQGVTYAA